MFKIVIPKAFQKTMVNDHFEIIYEDTLIDSLAEWFDHYEIPIVLKHSREEVWLDVESESHAVLIKLHMPEWRRDFTHNKVILPLIRNVMPTVLANSIIGVQPMSAPTAQIFNLQSRYGDDDD